MEKIVKCRGRVISKSQLEDVLYETHSSTCSNVVEVIVSNLRKKIKMHGAELPIKTRRGFGYYAEA
jgi:DNA-binding response OmpR family regulator